MLVALSESTEAGHLVKEAKKYLRGVKGTLVQKKKQEAEKLKRLEEAAKSPSLTANGQSGGYMQQHGYLTAQPSIGGLPTHAAPTTYQQPAFTPHNMHNGQDGGNRQPWQHQ